MMPDEWASNRSMARCVLPVFVGPRTAFTRAANPESEPTMGVMFGCGGAKCKRGCVTDARHRNYPLIVNGAPQFRACLAVWPHLLPPAEGLERIRQ